MSEDLRKEFQGAVDRLNNEARENRDRITRVEAGLEYHSRSVDELKVSIIAMNDKLDDIKTVINQAKGAASMTDWVTRNWPGLGAIMVAAAAFFKSGGPPAT
jgi:methyl-accepting chemotaxis protein